MLIRYYTFVLWILCSSLYAQEYSWNWAITAGGTENESLIGIGNDLLGNVYVLGSFSGENIDFTPEKRLINRLGYTNFLAKYDTDGQFEWAKGVYGKGQVRCNSLVVDDMGNCYVGGAYAGESLKFAEGIEIKNVGDRRQSEVLSEDMFIVKYNSEGEAEWARSYGGKNDDEILRLELDLEDNVYAVTKGIVKTKDNEKEGKISFNIQLKNLESHISLIKLDGEGADLWTTRIGYANEVFFRDIALTDNGDCYLTGTFNGDDQYMGDLRIRNISEAFTDRFLLKVNAEGTVEWVDIAGGSAIETDQHGNVYVLGGLGENAFEKHIELLDLRIESSHGEDLYIVKYSPEGKELWFRTFGSINGSYTKGYKAGADGLIYIFGFFEDDAYFGDIEVADRGLHLVSLDPEGDFEQVVQQIRDEDYSNVENALESNIRDIEINEFGEVYIAGVFRSEYFYLADKKFINKGRVGKRNDVFISKLIID